MLINFLQSSNLKNNYKKCILKCAAVQQQTAQVRRNKTILARNLKYLIFIKFNVFFKIQASSVDHLDHLFLLKRFAICSLFQT